MSANLHLEGRGAPSLYQTPTDAHVAECVAFVRATGSSDSLVTYW